MKQEKEKAREEAAKLVNEMCCINVHVHVHVYVHVHVQYVENPFF